MSTKNQSRLKSVALQLEVDAYYGQVYYNQTSLDQMADQAQRLMDQLSPRDEK